MEVGMNFSSFAAKREYIIANANQGNCIHCGASGDALFRIRMNDASMMFAHGYKCQACGCIVDPVILRNQILSTLLQEGRLFNDENELVIQSRVKKRTKYG